MDYIREKYRGYTMVATTNLEDELLLSKGEFMLIRREIAASLGERLD